jgi:hypothetical protein
MYRPEIFKHDLKVTEQQETETDIRDDDELPAMEDNTNKIQPFEPYVDADLDSFTSHALFIFSISIKPGCYMVAYSGIHKLSNSHIFNHVLCIGLKYLNMIQMKEPPRNKRMRRTQVMMMDYRHWKPIQTGYNRLSCMKI